jgi:hypothetical protein
LERFHAHVALFLTRAQEALEHLQAYVSLQENVAPLEARYLAGSKQQPVELRGGFQHLAGQEEALGPWPVFQVVD